MGLNLIHRTGPLKRLILAGWWWDARNKFGRFKNALPSEASIIDIGSGYGTVTHVLRKEGYRVQAVDIEDQAIHADFEPILYNGTTLPMDNDAFDFGLLLTVLHHTSDPVQVLKEAARVSRQVIVIEDVYRNVIQKYLTFWADSFFNFEFSGHPHSNKTRKGWETACAQLGLKLQVLRSDRFLLFFRQETYLITRA